MKASFSALRAVCAGLGALGLVGCSQEPPKCGSEETVSAVKSLFLDQLHDSATLKKLNVANLLVFEHPRAVTYDVGVKRWTCATNLKIAGKLDYPLEYTSQLDDGGDHLVSIDKLSWAESAVIATALFQSLDAKGDKAPTGVAQSVALSDIEGRWEGELEGNGSMEIAADPTGLTVSVGVSTESGCGGALTGKGSVRGNVLRVVASDPDQACTLTITLKGNVAEVEEGSGCAQYHGAACGFTGSLAKVR